MYQHQLVLQMNAREAADLEQERIRERALELKRLQEDQRERARLRHNEALKKELLKHVRGTTLCYNTSNIKVQVLSIWSL